MLKETSLKDFLNLASRAKRVGVFCELDLGVLSPIDLFEALNLEQRSGGMLETGTQKRAGVDSLYSFLFFDPFAELISKQNGITNQSIDQITTQKKGDPLSLLKNLMEELDCTAPDDQLSFLAGAVGFLGYDAVRFFEKIPDRHEKDADFPEVLFKFYRFSIAFDHSKKTLVLSQIVDVSSDPEEDFLEAKANLNQLVKKIQNIKASSQEEFPIREKEPALVEADVSDQNFMEKVAAAKSYIRKGDAFQIVLSRCFSRPYQSKPFHIYKILRKVSPAPYHFYLSNKNYVIVGASPEQLVGVKNSRVSINPIAGTRRRTPDQDLESIEKDLLTDEKEMAEHTMLVDLARNDIGAVCKAGSVKVKEMAQVKHFSHVSHIASIVEGELAPEFHSLDALAKAFPAGTLSGAPKIRAMEIIDELEGSRRGLYGGAVARLDFKKNLSSCIAIRMAVLKAGKAFVRTGAGIVYDSDPLSEANETRQKARGMLEAIAVAEGEKQS